MRARSGCCWSPRPAHGVRVVANTTVSERATYAYEPAFPLSGGDLHRDAHRVGIANLLNEAAPKV